MFCSCSAYVDEAQIFCDTRSQHRQGGSTGSGCTLTNAGFAKLGFNVFTWKCSASACVLISPVPEGFSVGPVAKLTTDGVQEDEDYENYSWEYVLFRRRC